MTTSHPLASLVTICGWTSSSVLSRRVGRTRCSRSSLPPSAWRPSVYNPAVRQAHTEREVTRVAIPVAELTQPLGPLLDALAREGYSRARLVLRLHASPLGHVDVPLPISAGEAADAVFRSVGDAIVEHLRLDGKPPIDALPPDGVPSDDAPACLERRRALLADPPRVAVIVPTRDRPDYLRRCLYALSSLEYGNFSILVADNSTGDETETLVRQSFPDVDYFRVAKRGYSTVRNAALRRVDAPYVALTDDDAVADRGWLAGLVERLQESSRVACATGLVLPLELETSAQILFEESGAFTSGYRSRVADLASAGPRSLLPYATGKIGAGVNMAWRSSVLREIGGFDRALDRNGGEDIAAFFDALVAGYRIVYEPRAVVRHAHRRDYESLRRQLYSHGVGLGAYLTRAVVTQPRRLPSLARRIPAGLRYGFAGKSPRNAGKEVGFPLELTLAEMRGFCVGPFIYTLARLHRGARSAEETPPSRVNLAAPAGGGLRGHGPALGSDRLGLVRGDRLAVGVADDVRGAAPHDGPGPLGGAGGDHA